MNRVGFGTHPPSPLHALVAHEGWRNILTHYPGRCPGLVLNRPFGAGSVSSVPCGTRRELEDAFQGLRPWLISAVASRRWGSQSEPPYVGCYGRKRRRAFRWLMRRLGSLAVGISHIAAAGRCDTAALRVAGQSLLTSAATRGNDGTCWRSSCAPEHYCPVAVAAPRKDSRLK